MAAVDARIEDRDRDFASADLPPGSKRRTLKLQVTPLGRHQGVHTGRPFRRDERTSFDTGGLPDPLRLNPGNRGITPQGIDGGPSGCRRHQPHHAQPHGPVHDEAVTRRHDLRGHAGRQAGKDGPGRDSQGGDAGTC